MTVVGWQFTFDPVTAQWTGAPSPSVSIPFGPGCEGVVIVTNEVTYDSGELHVDMTFGSAPLDLGATSIASSPRPVCAGG